MKRFHESAIDDCQNSVSYRTAHELAWETAEEIEGLMGLYTDEGYERDEDRVSSLASTYLSLLSDRVMILPSDES